eukprot:18717-Heterococcus_DN1.PRE.1
MTRGEGGSGTAAAAVCGGSLVACMRIRYSDLCEALCLLRSRAQALGLNSWQCVLQCAHNVHLSSRALMTLVRSYTAAHTAAASSVSTNL